MHGFKRHIDRVRNVTLPGDRLPFRLADVQVGWVKPGFATLLLGRGCRAADGGIVLDEAGDLPILARLLAAEGVFRDRREAFDVRAEPGGRVLTTIDRGALPSFGIAAEGVHLNGLVHRSDGIHLWVARRARNKTLDPGKLDHLVAGGIPAGMTPAETLVKEAAEEAGLDSKLVRQAVPVGIVAYDMERPEGLRRDLLHCYDLVLPENVEPVPQDGEVEAFELWPIQRALAAVRDTDEFKFNVNLVLIELFGRLGLIDADSPSLRPARP